jgi:predicted MarR family transcription regulator
MQETVEQETVYRWAAAKGLDMEEVEMGLEEASARFSRMQVRTRLMLKMCLLSDIKQL